MGNGAERTAADWFAAAARWHLQGHQGCVFCGGRHCVFRTERDGHVEYYCSTCDFCVSYDRHTGRHAMVPGAHNEVPDLILDVEFLAH
jgi:hypothetical protein